MRDCPIGTGPAGQSFTVLSEEYCKAELFLSVRDVQGSAVFFYNFLNGGDSQAVGVGIFFVCEETSFSFLHLIFLCVYNLIAEVSLFCIAGFSGNLPLLSGGDLAAGFYGVV